jgi:chemotaxis protein methyltransferase CheR
VLSQLFSSVASKKDSGENVPTLAADIPVSSAELRLLQTLIYQECGMFFDERRMQFLQERVQKRLKTCQLDSFYGYYLLLASPEGRQELASLLENLSVSETSFFRIRPQLEIFKKHVLPDLFKRKQVSRDFKLQIWSAGCATGQEPYTVAMLLGDALAFHGLRNGAPFERSTERSTPRPLIPAPWEVEVLASDINYSALLTARQGSYTEMQMETVDYPSRLRYFDKAADRYVVKPELKQMIQFDFHNLKTEFLPLHNDVIFCRNVMIYFDTAEQRRLIEKLNYCLNPEGYLFVGHAENLSGLTDKFRSVHHDGATVYQRVEKVPR